MQNGYVFLPTAKGIFAVDLIAWAQGEVDVVLPLHKGTVCSCLVAVGGIVCAIVRNAGAFLIGWKDLQSVFEISLSQPTPSCRYATPWLVGRVAYVVAESGTDVQVATVDLGVGGLIRASKLDGICRSVEPMPNGIACLMEMGGKRRIVTIGKDAVEEILWNVSDRTSWFQYDKAGGQLAWGDGHYLWMTNRSEVVQVPEIGSVRSGCFQEDSFLALSNRDYGSFLLAVNRKNPNLTRFEPIPEQLGAAAFVLADRRAIVSNEQRLTSVRLP